MLPFGATCDAVLQLKPTVIDVRKMYLHPYLH